MITKVKRVLQKKISQKKRYNNVKKDYILGGQYSEEYKKASVCGGDLTGKKVIITGGSRGVGLAICKRFLSEGASVLITGRNEKSLKEICDQMGDAKLKYFVWNLVNIENCSIKICEMSNLLGGIDVLVNNAGIYTEEDKNRDFLNMTQEVFDEVLNTNLKAPVFICQAVAQYMIDNKIKGHIVNITSINGFMPAFGMTSYGMSKASLIHFTKGIANILIKSGIVVNGIAPGWLATDMAGKKDGDSVYTTGIPSLRLGFPDEIAALCAFLASKFGENLIGEVVTSDGGKSLA